MNTIQVKPHPDLDPAAVPLIKHPASGGLLDASGKVPADGRPWLYDGVTCRFLADAVILRADDPLFAAVAAAEQAAAKALAEAAEAKTPTGDASAPPDAETPPAH